MENGTDLHFARNCMGTIFMEEFVSHWLNGWMDECLYSFTQPVVPCLFVPSFLRSLAYSYTHLSFSPLSSYPSKTFHKSKTKKNKKKNAYNYIIGIKLYICVPSFYTENFLFIYARISYCFPHTHLSQASLWHLDLFRELARYDRCIGKEVGWPSSLPSLPNYS